MNTFLPEAYYGQRKNDLSASLSIVQEKSSRLAWQRLAIVLLTFIAVYVTWNRTAAWFTVSEIIMGITLFIYTVSKDVDAKSKAQHMQKMLDVIQKEIEILKGNYSQFEGGENFVPANHMYAQDLDIFGKSSLFQYINRCTSQQGKKWLSQRLLHPLPTGNILEEQEAVIDLQNRTKFREEIQALGAQSPLTEMAEESMLQWSEAKPIYTENKWKIIAIIYPIVTLGVLFLYIVEVINSPLFSVLFFSFMVYAFSFSKKIGVVYDLLSAAIQSSDTFYKQLQLIEVESFSNAKLNILKKEVMSNSGTKASEEIHKLNNILNRFNIRLNTLAFFFLNTFLLWDLQQMISLNKWRNENETKLKHWFRLIAETEVSATLATLAFNHPHWTMPQVNNQFFHLQGTDIGHPLLIQKNRVNNSFTLEGKAKIAIVTGSNMGGKSTFLRSMGVNMVLAFSGAPVCAKELIVSNAQLMSSMRVADNLAESTSTFYAELKKLKTIIEAVKEEQPVFVLLDEILRGTNSLDRHAGSVALLKQFIQKRAVAVIATHDVELASLEVEYPAEISNYHFDVQTEGSELYFDYKLKDGVCTSMNASILMKNIGIEME